MDIRKLNLEELSGVVTIYPWFGAARKELCRRMCELGDGAWTDRDFSNTAIHVASRSILAELVSRGRVRNYSDSEVSSLLKKCFEGETEKKETEKVNEVRKIVVVGGDYFSRNQYESVRRTDDNIFSSFASKAREEGYRESPMSEMSDFCTETLARIYVEQEYYEQAVEIYSKLSLRYPEKSAYFASLIENIKNN